MHFFNIIRKGLINNNNKRNLFSIYPIDLLIYFNIFLSFISIWKGFNGLIIKTLLLLTIPIIYLNLKKYYVSRRMLKNISLKIVIISMLFFSLLVCFSQSSLRPIFYFLFFIYSIFFALILIAIPDRTYSISKNFFVFLVIWFLFEGLRLGFSSNSLNEYLSGSSRNIVSAIFLYSTIFLYMAKLNLNKKITMIPALVLFFISLISYGRSGIILSVLIFLSIILYVYFHKLKFKKIIFFFFILVVIIYLFINYGTILTNNTNLKKGLDSPRFLINMEYIRNLDTKSVLLGFDFKKIPIITKFNNNPHNSYINLHYNMGFSLIIFLLVIFINISKIFLKCFSIKNLTIIIFIIAYLIRAFFDIISFIGLFDFIFFYIFFSLINTDINKKLN